MNNECDIVRDLLPLYLDNVCSDTSRKFVENHLKACKKCNAEFKIMSEVQKEDNKKEEKNAFKNFSKSMKKKTVYKAMTIAIAALLMIGGGYQGIYAHENIMKYEKGLISIGKQTKNEFNLNINADNYKRADSIIEKNKNGNYDVYVNVSSTLATKMTKDKDKSNNFINIMNSGIMVDYQNAQMIEETVDADVTYNVEGETSKDNQIEYKKEKRNNGEIVKTEEKEEGNDISLSISKTGNDLSKTEQEITITVPNKDFNVENIENIYYYEGDLSDINKKSTDELKNQGLYLVWNVNDKN